MLAMELIPTIRTLLAELDEEPAGALTSGERAALWRAQQHAARVDRTMEDLRRYCLDSLDRWRALGESDENDYLRGYRQGFQTVLASNGFAAPWPNAVRSRSMSCSGASTRTWRRSRSGPRPTTPRRSR